ncbi:MAG: c-type cytochrome biogenesis protein CcmI [Alphaproteobacteria bacterium]|jgi:cytochrome c-type biogenesis protein CcmH|nr:c-type cytochrome biogenesis protein CcmI [Alphaproteobacteria bacterium]
MSVWLAIGALTLLAVLPILWALLRPSGARSERLDHDLEVYRDQLREVDAELAAGALTEREAGEARREIERRILRAAEQSETQSGPAAPSTFMAVAIALLLPALTLLLYSQLGQPGQPDQPLAEREVPSVAPRGLTTDQSNQVSEMIARLETRLQAQPDDLDGWILLGRSLAAVGDFDSAAKALRRAAALSDGDAEVYVALGDILTRGERGTVTPDALVAFRKALDLAPRNSAARYFLALANLQAGRSREAYEAWLNLYRDLPENSENRQALAEQIRQVAQEIGADPESALVAVGVADTPTATATSETEVRPGPDRAAMAAAADMPPDERKKFILSMVQRLADRLNDDPGDFEGWMRLGKAYGVLQKLDKSADAYGRAAAIRPSDPAPLDAQAMALIQSASSEQTLPKTTLNVLRKLEMLQPENARALWFLGMADAGAGRTEEAIDRWQRLYDQLPAGSKQRDGLEAAINRLRAAQ